MFYGCVGRLWGGKVRGKTFRSGEKLVVEFLFYHTKRDTPISTTEILRQPGSLLQFHTLSLPGLGSFSARNVLLTGPSLRSDESGVLPRH